jgi:phospholipid/cholesterol/gamma-HCH transport system permease protein
MPQDAHAPSLEAHTFTPPSCDIYHAPEGLRILIKGAWIAEFAPDIEAFATKIEQEAAHAEVVVLEEEIMSPRVLYDLGDIERLDTLGAWILDRTRQRLIAHGMMHESVRVSAQHQVLLKEVSYREIKQIDPMPTSIGAKFLADVGETVVGSGRDIRSGVEFLGEVIGATMRVLVKPRQFRTASFVHHLEQIALRGLPIVALISFLVGSIVAQQTIFQLQKFGAALFVADMIGILSLRELGILLAAIMVAGRSGSAFTAEIGSMKMREEIDALRVMGLDPVEILIIPRILALVIGLPMLTFVASMASLLGGGLVAWVYGDMSPDIFMARLQSLITFKTFFVGMIKAPFMALVIGLIALSEGLAVKGSAESLGQRVTASVVKSIFMVIVLDGLFAMFFASIRV